MWRDLALAAQGGASPRHAAECRGWGVGESLSAFAFTRRAGRRHVAGKTTPAFDFKLAIFDSPGDEARRTDQEAAAHFKLALEAPANVGGLDGGRATE